jgi:hypothetical protein
MEEVGGFGGSDGEGECPVAAGQAVDARASLLLQQAQVAPHMQLPQAQRARAAELLEGSDARAGDTAGMDETGRGGGGALAVVGQGEERVGHLWEEGRGRSD